MAKDDALAPQDVEAEKAVLAACLVDNRALSEVRGVVRPGDFHEHGGAFAAMLALQDAGEPVNYVTLTDRGVKGALVADLVALPAMAGEAPAYARIVARTAQQRRMMDAGARVTRLAFEGADGFEDEALAAVVDAGRNERHRAVAMRDAASAHFDAVEAIAKNGGLPPEVPTGFADLDRLIDGFRRQDVYVLAARPKQGKTAFALNVFRHVAKAGRRVAFFSLEMARDLLMARLAAMESGLGSREIERGQVQPHEYPQWMKAVAGIAEWDAFVDDSGTVTPSYLRGELLRLDPDLAIVDYLQLMRTDTRQPNLYHAVTEVSRELKRLAKDLDLPVLAVSQLSRGVDDRQDKRPRPSDLRDSGYLEQDAAVVMLLYRDEVYHEDTERRGIADLEVAMNRHGGTGTCSFVFKPERGLFLPAEVRREPIGEIFW